MTEKLTLMEFIASTAYFNKGNVQANYDYFCPTISLLLMASEISSKTEVC